jgi:23S rRNA pseudouridine2605 synthase
MMNGLDLNDASAGAHRLTKQKEMKFAPFVGYKIIKNAPNFSRLSIILNEGQNRELRRFFAYHRSEVLDLKRVAFGFVHLNALPAGKTRYLNKAEYNKLHQFLKGEYSDSQDSFEE